MTEEGKKSSNGPDSALEASRLEEVEPPASQQAEPPLPPVSSNQSVQLAVGAQLGRSNFNDLAPEVQHELIKLADKQDQRQFDYHCKSLERQSQIHGDSLRDGAVARKQGIWALSVITGLGLAIVGFGTIFLLVKGEYQWGFTLLITGVGLVGAFLGGAGLPGFLRSLSKGLKGSDT